MWYNKLEDAVANELFTHVLEATEIQLIAKCSPSLVDFYIYIYWCVYIYIYIYICTRTYIYTDTYMAVKDDLRINPRKKIQAEL